MADLVIEPIRPAVSSSVNIPDTTTRTKAVGDAFDKAQEVIQSLAKQYQDMQNDNALIDYKKGLTDLDDQMTQIRDPKAKISLYKAGQDDLYNKILKQYPNLSIGGQKSIQFEMASDLREHVVKTANDARDQAIKDDKAYFENIIKQSTLAKTKTEQENMLRAGLNHLTNSVNNNLYSQDEANLIKTNMIAGVRDSEAGVLAHDHPSDFLGTTAEQLGIPQPKWDSWANVANKQLVDRETAGTIQQEKDEGDALAGMTSANAQAAVDRFPYSNKIKARFAYLTGHKPVDSDEALAAHYSDLMHQATTLDDLNQVKKKAIAAGVTGPGMTTLNQDYDIVSRDIKDGTKARHDDIYNRVKTKLENARYEATSGDEMSDEKMKNLNFENQTLRQLNVDLEASKDTKDNKAAQAAEDRAMKAIGDYYKPETTTITKPTAPAGLRAD